MKVWIAWVARYGPFSRWRDCAGVGRMLVQFAVGWRVGAARELRGARGRDRRLCRRGNCARCARL